MQFSLFSHFLQDIESRSKRLEITDILSQLFAKLDAQEITEATYLLQGSLVPNYLSLEFQMSDKMLLRALAHLTATTGNEAVDLFAEVAPTISENASQLNVLKKRYKQVGDIGELFFEELSKVDHSAARELSVLEVYQSLKQIALVGGAGSQEMKVDLLVKLLEQLDPFSSKYVSRIILGKMRLGFSTMTILDALSFAKHSSKQDSAALEQAFLKKADLGKLAKSYLQDYRQKSIEEFLQLYQVEWGVPVLPALCQRLNSATEIIEKMGPVMAEAKYDGLRVQIHFSQNQCKAFTRNLEDVSHMFPELAKLAQSIKAVDCVLDTEAIGIDTKTGAFLSFQDTIQRKRKHDVAAKALEIPLRFYVFDILFLDGQSLLDESLSKRKELLAATITDSVLIEKTKFQLIDQADALKKFHEQQLSLGLEGAVMKQPDSLYMSGRKGWRWVKIKEEEGSRGKLSDTIDCVMMGYYLGKGKRQSFGVGALLVGVLDRDADGQWQVKTLSKIGTGLTDEQFRQIKTLADAHQSTDKPEIYLVDKNLFPDVWLEPFVVLEVAADEISQSPIHSAGVALRFPRLIKIRDDKSWQDATSVSELDEIKIST
jgi:DNA ligase-1